MVPVTGWEIIQTNAVAPESIVHADIVVLHIPYLIQGLNAELTIELR